MDPTYMPLSRAMKDLITLADKAKALTDEEIAEEKAKRKAQEDARRRAFDAKIALLVPWVETVLMEALLQSTVTRKDISLIFFPVALTPAREYPSHRIVPKELPQGLPTVEAAILRLLTPIQETLSVRGLPLHVKRLVTQEVILLDLATAWSTP